MCGWLSPVALFVEAGEAAGSTILYEGDWQGFRSALLREGGGHLSSMLPERACNHGTDSRSGGFRGHGRDKVDLKDPSRMEWRPT
jgi:hypothetical protein